ncbi:MAG: hypothetical protein NBV68_08030 [Erythrobacter sp.]|uniref:hypothetical protein n=1 Tax=Erythrobacter sp. TaxID=1042 RepID=UPI0025FC7170|nr:hypothetical protein [Erythrobacter sp.]MCL9999314.1 hypothetical protein [Erythrobacter sp.]
MRDRDKPFVMYRRGPGNFTIVPRGVVGWSQFAVWMALLGALVVWFAEHTELNSRSADYYFGLALFGIGVFVWMVAGLWWMIVRAEVVDIVELMRDRQREQRKRRRRR